jgi:tyrosine-protein kinase Etk/Wzc
MTVKDMGMTSALRGKLGAIVGASDIEVIPRDIPVELRSRPESPLITDPTQRALNEHFGTLAARVVTAHNKAGIRHFLITSPQRHDGKSFTSVNLAISLAQLEYERVLLIDGDLRMHGITSILGLEQRTGLADFLQRAALFQVCVKPTTLSYLHVVPAGNIVEDLLPGILAGSRWPEFLEKAKQQFDVIIVDSVPVSAPIADFELLLAACDSALLVVQMRHTTREAINVSTQRMQRKLLGVVINKIAPGRRTGYYSGYGYTKSNT